MRSCGGERERPGGLTGPDAEVGALVWVVRRDGCWWPGRILGMDELPESCFIPPRCTDTPIKLLGRPDGSIDWYNLVKSKRVKPFQCGEFDKCIENAMVRASQQKMIYSEENYAFRENAIMHALEIERSRFPHEGHLNTYGSCASIKDQISKPINKTTECSKEGISSIRDHRGFKMKIISFVTPISKESHESNKNSLPQLYEGTMKCQALDSDAVGLDARVEGAVCESAELKNNTQIHDVELTVHGNYEGRHLPLAFLISKWTGKLIKGYPVTVEVLEDSCSAASIDDHHPAISSLDYLLESRISVPRKARSSHASRSKPGGHKRIAKHDLDYSWRPHTKKLAPAASPRKVQRRSSSASSQRESANRNPVVAEGSLLPTCSLPGANRKPVIAKGSLLPTCAPPGAAFDTSSTSGYHVGPTTPFAGCRGLPLSPSPAASSTRSSNGCTSLYLCSASSLCAPVHLVWLGGKAGANDG